MIRWGSEGVREVWVRGYIGGRGTYIGERGGEDGSGGGGRDMEVKRRGRGIG